MNMQMNMPDGDMRRLPRFCTRLNLQLCPLDTIQAYDVYQREGAVLPAPHVTTKKMCRGSTTIA